jgi:hypothetical protein
VAYYGNIPNMSSNRTGRNKFCYLSKLFLFFLLFSFTDLRRAVFVKIYNLHSPSKEVEKFPPLDSNPPVVIAQRQKVKQ